MNKKNILIIIITILTTAILSVGITLSIAISRQNSAINKIARMYIFVIYYTKV